MKMWFSILFTTMLLFCSSQSTLLLVDYHVNQDFYELHCENKAKPELNCHGKCQLSKTENQKPQSQLLLICCGFSFTKPAQIAFVLDKKSIDFAEKMTELKPLNYKSRAAKLLEEPPIVG